MAWEPSAPLVFMSADIVPLILVGGGLLLLLVVFWFIPAVFLFSARTAGVENRSYGKALLTIILRFFASVLITVVFSLLPIIGTFLGIVVAFLVNGAIIAGIFSTSYGKGILTEFLFMFFGFLITVCVGIAAVAGVIFFGGMGVFQQIQRDIQSGEFRWEAPESPVHPGDSYEYEKEWPKHTTLDFSETQEFLDRTSEASSPPKEDKRAEEKPPAVNVASDDFGARAKAGSVGSYMGESHPARLAIDGDLTTAWCNSGKIPDTLEITFQRTYLIDEVGAVWNRGVHNQKFSIALSEDGSRWVTVVPPRYVDPTTVNASGYHPLDKDFTLTFDIPPRKAKYMRVTITATNAPSSHIFQAIVTDVIAKTAE